MNRRNFLRAFTTTPLLGIVPMPIVAFSGVLHGLNTSGVIVTQANALTKKEWTEWMNLILKLPPNPKVIYTRGNLFKLLKENKI